MHTCILLSTCDRYIPLARMTVDLLDRRWKDHPPIFLCGASTAFISQVEVLPLRESPDDWIGITASAANTLLKKGYRKCYLILEDHPPLAICNERDLNETLPNLMDKLGAAYIGLYGWDQGTLSEGKVLSSAYHYLQQQSDTFQWKFSLHPALWNLEALYDVTEALPLLENSKITRSAWAFERRSGSLSKTESLLRWQGGSYRVFGAGMLAGKYRMIRALIRGLYFYSLNALLWIVRKVLGFSVQDRISDAMLPEKLFFDGPYPLYWSGVLQKGALNRNFEKFLLKGKRMDELEEIRRIINSFDS